MMKMTLEDAIKILGEIAIGDQERDAYDTLVFACENYRAMAESLHKRLERFRDLAAMPDIPDNLVAQKDNPEGVDVEKLNGSAASCEAKY